MTPAKLFVAVAIGLSAAACSYSNTTTQASVPVARSSSEQACVDYGFQPGSDSYNRCVAREAEARARGRAPVTYASANLASDAQAACYSYGLTPGNSAFDRCVGREIDARRYSQDTVVTTYSTPVTYSTPAPSTTVYTVPGPGGPTTTVYTTMPATTVVPAATTPPAGVQAFRDEFGFRYDGQGNRIDGNGNIISPQSTRP